MEDLKSRLIKIADKIIEIQTSNSEWKYIDLDQLIPQYKRLRVELDEKVIK
jgi:hypothetical protein